MAKNVICLWYDGTAEDAAGFYARTFPNSAVTAVHHAPGDYPAGKQGQVLTVEFTVLGSRDRSLLECDRRQRRSRKRVRVVQGPMGLVLADHPACTPGSDDQSGSGSRQARVRGDDGNEEDRHRRDRGSDEIRGPQGHRRQSLTRQILPSRPMLATWAR